MLQVTLLLIVTALVAVWESRKMIPWLRTVASDQLTRASALVLLMAPAGLFSLILLGLTLAMTITGDVVWTFLSAPILIAPFFVEIFRDAFRRPGST